MTIFLYIRQGVRLRICINILLSYSLHTGAKEIDHNMSKTQYLCANESVEDIWSSQAS